MVEVRTTYLRACGLGCMCVTHRSSGIVRFQDPMKKHGVWFNEMNGCDPYVNVA